MITIYANKLMLMGRAAISYLIVGPVGAGFLMTPHPLPKVWGMLMLLLPFFWLMQFVAKPLMQVSGRRLSFKNFLGLSILVENIREIDLYINRDDMMFRYDDGSEKTFLSKFLSKQDWVSLERKLRCEEFRSVRSYSDSEF